jgi:hypothetical protein
MSSSAPRILTAACAAAFLAACAAEVPALPAGADVTCSTSDDCPSGTLCSTVLGRCISESTSDRQAPGIVAGTGTVTPTTASAGALVTVSFEADEDLAMVPEIRFSGAPGTLGTPRRDGRRYTLEFPASTDDGEGAHPIVARLVDVYGNVAETVPVGTATFDFTAPLAAAPIVTPAFARATSVLTAEVTLSETAGGTPALALDGGPALDAAPGPGPNQWTFTRTLDGSEPTGTVDLLLDVRDVAGNELVRRFGGAARIDFAQPTVSGADVRTPTVREGDTFVAEVRFDEPLGVAPDVMLVPAGGGAGVAVTASAIDAFTWALSYQVPVGAADDDLVLHLVEARDRAGNAGGALDLGAVRVDSTEPTVLALAPDHASRLYRATEPVSVSFATDEVLAAAPVVRLETSPAAEAMPCIAGAPPRSWICTSSPLDGTERPESVVNVSVRVSDGAGNLAVEAATVVLDFTLPVVAGAPAAQLIPGAGNPRSSITALGTGSTYRLSLIASEPLAAPPAVRAFDPGSASSLALSLVAQSGTSFVYQLSTGASVYPAATWNVTWDPIDEAGNRWPSPQVVTTVAVDSEAPVAPVTGTAAAPVLLWTRTPWGTDTSSTSSFHLVGSAGSISSADLAIAWDGAAGREVGRGAVAAGAFDVTLSSDPLDLWVSAVDAAGNESPRTRVVDVAWTAGLAGKVAGSTFENPHTLETRRASIRTLDQQDGVDVNATALGVKADGLVVQTTGASFYRPIAGATAPAGRRMFALAHDSGRGRLVLYGGQSGSIRPADTWEWDGSTWAQMTPSDPEGDGNPEAWEGVPLVYDPIRGGVVLITTQTWLWNGESWRSLASWPSPGNKQGSAAAWDEGRGVIVHFGGGGPNADTWEWNGTTWTNVTPASAADSPPPRYWHGMAYDRVRGRVAVFGGMDYFVGMNDVWEWDGTRWTQLTVLGTPPPARAGAAVAWDASTGTGELVVQGGGFMGGGTDGRTWVMRIVSGNPTWFDATPATTTVDMYHAAAYDQGTGRVLMVGDQNDGRLRAWSGSLATTKKWSLLAPGDPESDGNPSHTLADDGDIAWNASRGATVYHDGRAQETWEWNHASWVRLATSVTVPVPSARSDHALGSYGTGAILYGGDVFGSSIGDTWRWNGSAWTQLIASPARPVPTSHYDYFRENHAMVTDPSTGKLYRFGGTDRAGGAGITCYSDVWEWNNAGLPNNWLKIGGEPWADPQGDGSPPSGVGGGNTCAPRGFTVWDPGRAGMVYYPRWGATIWEWLPPPSNSWLLHTMGTTGSWPTSERALLYDTTLGAPVIVSGGLLGGQAWVVDLTANVFREIPLSNPFGLPKPDDWVASFDGDAGNAVVVASSTYTWQSGSSTTPAHVLHVDFSRANGPDPGVCVVRAACPFQQIDVRWTGGGSSPAGNGARLQAWTGSWTDLPPILSAPASAPADTTWSWTNAAAFPASSLFHGTSREMTFQLVPSGVSTAAGAAQVGTDAASVTVRYRRP